MPFGHDTKLQDPLEDVLKSNGLSYENGKLCLEGFPFEELAREFSTPLLVVSEPNMHRIAQSLLVLIGRLDATLCPRPNYISGARGEHRPSARIFSSISQSATLGLLRSLNSLQIGLIANSLREVERAMCAQVHPHNVVLTGILKSRSSFEEARKRGLGAIEILCWSDLETLLSLPEGDSPLRVSLRALAPWCPNYMGLGSEELWAAVTLVTSRPDFRLVGLSCAWDSCEDCSAQEYSALLGKIKRLGNDLLASGSDLEWVMVGPRGTSPGGNISHMKPCQDEAEYAEITEKVFSGCSFRVYFSCGDALLRQSCHVVGKIARRFSDPNLSDFSDNPVQRFLSDLVVDAGCVDAQSAVSGGQGAKLSVENHLVFPLQQPQPFDGQNPVLSEIWTRFAESAPFEKLGRWSLGAIASNDFLLYPCSGVQVFEACHQLENAPTEILLHQDCDYTVIRCRRQPSSGFETEF